MTCIHEKEVNKLSELNLLHYIINTTKRTKTFNIHYSPIIQGFMNTRKGKARFKNFLILLYSGCSSTIIMGRLINKPTHKKDFVMQWNTQEGKITHNLKVKIDFVLTELSTTKIMTWNCHVDESAKVRYDMILGICVLTALGLNLKFSDHVIE